MITLNRSNVAYLGFAAAAMFLIGWALSAYLNGSWDYGVNTLSSLGYTGQPLARIMFNWTGCIAAAILWGIEMIWITKHETGRVRTYAIVTLVSLVFLAGIGIVDGRYGRIHLFVSFGYMGITGAAMIVSTFTKFFRSRKIFAGYTGVMIVFDVICYFTLNFELFEANAVLLAILWSAMISYAYRDYSIKNGLV
ncbi:MAG: hypothetical protein MJZ21_03800 [archaeon]|nr:hypothetical protein [archaeon]